MDKLDVLVKLREKKLVSVVRIDSTQPKAVINSIIKGGISFIEITFTMDGALELISSLTKEHKEDSNVIIGAGTVLDETSARLAIINGAKFIVSPSFNSKVAEICNLYRIAYIPGVHNPNDIQLALRSGCDVLKLFPASTLDPFIIKEFKGPYPQAQFMVSGKVNYKNALDWINAGAIAICLGSVLTNEEKNGLDLITTIGRKFVDLIDD